MKCLKTKGSRCQIKFQLRLINWFTLIICSVSHTIKSCNEHKLSYKAVTGDWCLTTLYGGHFRKIFLALYIFTVPFRVGDDLATASVGSNAFVGFWLQAWVRREMVYSLGAHWTPCEKAQNKCHLILAFLPLSFSALTKCCHVSSHILLPCVFLIYSKVILSNYLLKKLTRELASFQRLFKHHTIPSCFQNPICWQSESASIKIQWAGPSTSFLHLVCIAIVLHFQKQGSRAAAVTQDI